MQVIMHEAKTNLSKLVTRALAGEDVIIAKNGKPLIKLNPVNDPGKKRTAGLSRGKVHMSDDFNAPL